MTDSTGVLAPLEDWSAPAFLVAGGFFVINAAIVATGIATNSERLIMLLGQAFVGAGWTAAFIGMLGLYPALADRSRWLVRVAAFLIVIGVVIFTVMAVASLLYYLGIPDGEITALLPVFLPGVILSSILGVGLFSVASLRTDVHSRTVGLLLLALPLIVVTNILRGVVAGIESPIATLVIVIALTLVNVAIGYRLRVEGLPTDRADPSVGPTVE